MGHNCTFSPIGSFRLSELKIRQLKTYNESSITRLKCHRLSRKYIQIIEKVCIVAYSARYIYASIILRNFAEIKTLTRKGYLNYIRAEKKSANVFKIEID